MLLDIFKARKPFFTTLAFDRAFERKSVNCGIEAVDYYVNEVQFLGPGPSNCNGIQPVYVM